MGQCPIVLPSGPDDYPDLVRKGCAKGESATKKEAFLSAHKFIKSQACMIDPSDVKNVLEYQAEKMKLKGVELAKSSESVMCDDFDNKTTTDVTVANSAALSHSTYKTATTEGTDTTTKTGNGVRNEQNQDGNPVSTSRAQKPPNLVPNQSQNKQCGVLSTEKDGEYDEQRIPGIRSFGSDGSFVVHDINNDSPQSTKKGSVVSMYHQKYQSKHISEADSMDQKYSDAPSVEAPAVKGCLSPLLPLCFKGQYLFHPKELSSALHLKMKARLVPFYQKDYLKAFPGSPIPKGLVSSRRQNHLQVKWKQAIRERSTEQTTLPNLVQSTTDSTASSAPENGQTVEGYPIQLAVDNSSFLDLAVTGSFGLFNRSTNAAESSLKSCAQESSSQQKPPRHYLALINERTGEPLAICALKSQKGPPVVRIYGTKPRVKGQEPAASTSQLGLDYGYHSSLPLFAWAELVAEGEFPQPVRYSIYNSSGSGGKFEKEPTYRGSHCVVGSPDIMVVGRTGLDHQYHGCCQISLKMDKDLDVDEAYFELSISHGLDPAIFICFVAILDETMESGMRTRFGAHIRKQLKKVKKENGP